MQVKNSVKKEKRIASKDLVLIGEMEKEKKKKASQIPEEISHLLNEMTQQVKKIDFQEAYITLKQLQNMNFVIPFRSYGPVLNAMMKLTNKKNLSNKKQCSISPAFALEFIDSLLKPSWTRLPKRSMNALTNVKLVSNIVKMLAGKNLNGANFTDIAREWFNYLNMKMLNLETVNALVQTYSKQNHFDEAFNIVSVYSSLIGPNLETFCLLMDCGDKYQMAKAWRKMRPYGLHISDNAEIFARIILSLYRQNEKDMALAIFWHMTRERRLIPSTNQIAACLFKSFSKNEKVIEELTRYYKEDYPSELYNSTLKRIMSRKKCISE
jgi:hypothetical protein